jgi:hypothetical protein
MEVSIHGVLFRCVVDCGRRNMLSSFNNDRIKSEKKMMYLINPHSLPTLHLGSYFPSSQTKVVYGSALVVRQHS